MANYSSWGRLSTPLIMNSVLLDVFVALRALAGWLWRSFLVPTWFLPPMQPTPFQLFSVWWMARSQEVCACSLGGRCLLSGVLLRLMTNPTMVYGCLLSALGFRQGKCRLFCYQNEAGAMAACCGHSPVLSVVSVPKPTS